MKPKSGDVKGLSRRDFFKVASAAGFGTAAGAFLYGIPGYDFPPGPGDSKHSFGVLYRITDADEADIRSFSEGEILLEPGSETFVMNNDVSEVLNEGISGEAIVVTDEVPPAEQVFRATKSKKQIVKKGRSFQILNPSKERAMIKQKFSPIWNSDNTYLLVGNQKIRSSEVWFELRESFDRQETGVKYKLVKQTKGQVESLARVEPGVKSAVEYFLKGSLSFKVIEGKGIIVIDGKERELGPNDKVTINAGMKYQFYNPFNVRWEMEVVAKPRWLPNNFRYIVGNKEIKGSDVWFGMRI